MHLNFKSPHLQVWDRLKAAALELDEEFHALVVKAEAEAHKLFVSGEPHPTLPPGPAIPASAIPQPPAPPAPAPVVEPPAEPPGTLPAVVVGARGAFFPSNSKFSVGAEIVHVWSPNCVNLETDDGQKPTSVLVLHPNYSSTLSGYYFMIGAEPKLAPVATQEMQALSSEPVSALTTEQLQSFNTEPVAALSTEPVAALTTEQVSALATSDVAALPAAEVPQSSGTAAQT